MVVICVLEAIIPTFYLCKRKETILNLDFKITSVF